MPRFDPGALRDGNGSGLLVHHLKSRVSFAKGIAMWLGIDFGTCFSSAALMLEERPTSVEFGHNRTSLPSSVYVNEGGDILVGQVAENKRQVDLLRFKREFKRDLQNNDTPYTLGDSKLFPQDLVVEVLKTLKRAAEDQVMEEAPLSSVVLTVPTDYEGTRRRLMEDAARAAGFSQVQLLDEPEAAARYYAWQTRASQGLAEGDALLVYDLGGGTFDAALLQKQGAEYVPLALSSGHPHLGGIDFDRAIYQDLLARSSDAVRAAFDRQGVERLLTQLWAQDACRDLKHQLSEDTEAVVRLPQAPLEPYTLSREAFEALIAPLITETVELCQMLVEDKAGLGWEQVKRVVLVGGSCRIPYVSQELAGAIGRPDAIVRAGNPELAVCLGAALYGAGLDEIKDIGFDLGHGERAVTSLDYISTGIYTHSESVRTVAFSLDGHMLASGSNDCTIVLWEVSTGQKLRTLAEHSNWVRTVAFSPDGHMLASGSNDHTIVLWEVSTGQKLRTLAGHSGCVHSVAFSPDGRTLVSGSDDHTIVLWWGEEGGVSDQYARLRCLLRTQDWSAADRESIQIIRAASGFACIDSEFKAQRTPANVLRHLNHLWLTYEGGKLYERNWVKFPSDITDFTAWYSFNTWLRWRLKDLGLN